MNDYIGRCLSEVMRYKSKDSSIDFNDLLDENLTYPGCKFIELFGELRSTDSRYNPDMRTRMSKILYSLQDQINGGAWDNDSPPSKYLSASVLYKGMEDDTGNGQELVKNFFRSNGKGVDCGLQGDSWLNLRRAVGGGLGGKEKVEK